MGAEHIALYLLLDLLPDHLPLVDLHDLLLDLHYARLPLGVVDLPEHDEGLSRRSQYGLRSLDDSAHLLNAIVQLTH